MLCRKSFLEIRGRQKRLNLVTLAVPPPSTFPFLPTHKSGTLNPSRLTTLLNLNGQPEKLFYLLRVQF